MITRANSTKSIAIALSLALAHFATAAEYLNPPGAEDLKLPFSDAVRVGNMLILSGKLGTLPGTTNLVSGGIKPEARQALENIKASLERYGASMEDVVKCTVMIADIAEWPDFNEVYITYFPGPKPARSAFGAAGLAFDGRVEVECWAELKPQGT
ncbi:MAG: Rid family hydrolase [Pseudomonadales bacterium]|jgi:reactive intermediate/imine deaminase|nr:Rid family hydrolase [Pseudomonadales bacterium]MDP6472163.1 Rid family hydrolase [Pseudomonadales bacterium]MDP6826585.1 Rid family hydrolase [Pseudomonadales bacterium]MDP6970144.1 Rid family hydrolase [Pseudomonadales bacterium]|tara:strand:- start:56 stop:520 length:465 start_codon:yes stop_codon:yes gene_type:complete